MRYVRFTDEQTGEPLWLREDQVLGWFPEKAHYRITPAFDEVDVDVRENGEQILAIMEGRKDNIHGVQTGNDKPIEPRIQQELSGVQKLGREQRGERRRRDLP